MVRRPVVERIQDFLAEGLGVSLATLRKMGSAHGLVKVAKEGRGYGFHFKTREQMVAFKNATKKDYEKELEHSREGKVGDLYRVLIEPE